MVLVGLLRGNAVRGVGVPFLEDDVVRTDVPAEFHEASGVSCNLEHLGRGPGGALRKRRSRSRCEPRPSLTKLTSIPAWVEPVTVHTMM